MGLCLLVGAAVAAGDDSSKEPTRGTTIAPGSVPLKPGGALSVRTPVVRPRSLKGAVSWTIETRRHRWAPVDLTLSPDGKLLATSGYDGAIRLWETATGKLARVLVGHDSYVYGMAWSRDGRYLASAGVFDYTVRVWEVSSGLPLRVLKGIKDAPICVAWSPDGSLLAAGSAESGYVAFWRVTTGNLVKQVSNGKTVTALAFTPDGLSIACGVSQVGVVLRLAPAYAADSQVDLTAQDTRGLSFSDDGKLVVATTKQALVWDPATKKTLKTIKEPATAMARHGNRLALAYSPAGKMVDLQTGKPGVALPYASVMAWSSDGKALYLLSGEDVVRVDPDKGTEVKRWNVAGSGTVYWSPGKPMVTGIGTLTPRLWDTATGKLLHSLEGHTAGMSALAWSPGGKVLATGGYDKTVRVWSPTTGKLQRTLTGIDSYVTAVAVAGDGKIAVGAADQKVRVFTTKEDKPSKTLMGHTDAVRALAWGKDGRLASGGLDASVRLWDVGTGKLLHTLEHPGSVESLAFAPNGKLLAAGASEHRVRVWSYPGRKMLHEFTSLGSPPSVTSLAWGPDSAQLFAGRSNHTAQLWDLKLGKDRLNIAALAPVQSVSWAAGGRTLATCSLDRCVRFWSAANGQLLTTVVADGDQISCISAEGHYRIANEDNTELVGVVLTKTAMETVPPKELERFGWKNNPTRAKMTGN
jgi:WD40 repeat protein